MADDISKLPPHVRQQATQAAQESGVAKQAASTQQGFSQGEGADNAARSQPERAREAQQEQQRYDQSQTPQPTQDPTRKQ